MCVSKYKLDLVFYVLFEVYDVNFNCNNLKKIPPMIINLFFNEKEEEACAQQH
jgi:hypothetical protein